MWLKFNRRWCSEVVVAKGHFDFDGGVWMHD